MAQPTFSLRSVRHTPGKSDLPTHTAGTARGEEWIGEHGREPGRDGPQGVRLARDSTSINPQQREPIDSRMPHLPPA